MRLAALLLPVVLFAPHASADEAACPTEVEYAVTGTLVLSDTPMGKGNGSYAIGPGKAVMRFDHGEVKLLSFTMHESFTVRAKTGPWTTVVETDATSTATPHTCSLTEGTFDGHTLHFRGPIRDYHTDGTITCSGSFCGMLGTPARGQSPLHVGPMPQPLNDLVFSPDLRTFTMAQTPAVKMTNPKQSSAVSMSGRQTKRTCAASACAEGAKQ